jgi:GTP pyrophosphokinase
LLSKAGMINFSVTGRVKSPYRIYEKLIKKYQKLDFSKVLDVMAFRVVVDNIPECYNVLGIIHSAYNPLINKIKDYIAVPKFNDYQSLHTTIL